MRISFPDSHRHTRLQLLLALNLIHRTFNHMDIDFRYFQMSIQFINSAEDKVFCLEVYGIIRLAVDLTPQVLELLAGKLLRVELCLTMLSGILGLHRLRIEYSIQLLDNAIFEFIIFLSEVEHALLLLIKELLCQLALLGDIAIKAEHEVDIVGGIVIHLTLIAAIGVHKRHTHKQTGLYFLRTVSYRLSYLCL